RFAPLSSAGETTSSATRLAALLTWTTVGTAVSSRLKSKAPRCDFLSSGTKPCHRRLRLNGAMLMPFKTWKVHAMRSIGLVVIALSFSCVQLAPAAADDASPPKTTATRPATEHPQENSVPNNAPPADNKHITGSTNQDPTIKQMNAEGERKLKIEGK